MTLENFSDLSQIVASIGVVISLIYLAVQTRQATKSHLAQMHQMRNAQIIGLMVRSTEPDFQAVFRAGGLGEPLSPEDATRFFNYIQATFRGIDEQFIAHKEGMISDDRWRKTEAYVGRTMTLPGVRAVYVILRDGGAFDKGFVELADKALAAAR